MFGRFLPRETSFFDIFEKHAAIIIHATQGFQTLVSTDLLFEQTDKEQFKQWEHDGDIIAHECMDALHKTFITPIEREDILRLMSKMDDILDDVDACVDCLMIYRIQKPTAELQQLAQILYQSSVKVFHIVEGLRNLKNAGEIRADCQVIRHLEHSADIALRKAIGKLFDEEKDTRLVIKLKEIYEILEDAIDSCHRVANFIEGILLECD